MAESLRCWVELNPGYPPEKGDDSVRPASPRGVWELSAQDAPGLGNGGRVLLSTLVTGIVFKE